jgi:hypothetical protein
MRVRSQAIIYFRRLKTEFYDLIVNGINSVDNKQFLNTRTLVPLDCGCTGLGRWLLRNETIHE